MFTVTTYSPTAKRSKMVRIGYDPIPRFNLVRSFDGPTAQTDAERWARDQVEAHGAHYAMVVRS